MRLEGRTVLVTGAGSGIGRALAIEASLRGAAVCLCGRRPEKLRETLVRLDPNRAHLVVSADITCEADIARLAQALTAQWGALDLLVNNAGRLATGALETATHAQIAGIIDTNVVAPMILTQRLLPLLERGKGPRIVNIGSMFGEIPFPGFVAYSASKAAMKGFSMALRRELLHQGIGVTHAAPRATDTDGAASVAAAIAGQRLDDPGRVAARIWDAVERGRDHVYPSPAERVFLVVQAVAPRLVDRAISPARNARPAQTLAMQEDFTHVER